MAGSESVMMMEVSGVRVAVGVRVALRRGRKILHLVHLRQRVSVLAVHKIHHTGSLAGIVIV